VTVSINFPEEIKKEVYEKIRIDFVMKFGSVIIKQGVFKIKTLTFKDKLYSFRNMKAQFNNVDQQGSAFGRLHGNNGGFNILTSGNTSITTNRKRVLETIENITLSFKFRGRLNVKFQNERGIDCGGLSREFFDLVGR
jgi:predicted metal-dependent RNase